MSENLSLIHSIVIDSTKAGIKFRLPKYVRLEFVDSVLLDFNLTKVYLKISGVKYLVYKTVRILNNISYKPLELVCPPLKNIESSLALVRAILYKNFKIEVESILIENKCYDEVNNKEYWRLGFVIRSYMKTENFNAFQPRIISTMERALDTFLQQDKFETNPLYVDRTMELAIIKKLDWTLIDSCSLLGNTLTMEDIKLAADSRVWYNISQLPPSIQENIISLEGIAVVVRNMTETKESSTKSMLDYNSWLELYSSFQYKKDGAFILEPFFPDNLIVPFKNNLLITEEESSSITAATEQLKDKGVSTFCFDSLSTGHLEHYLELAKQYGFQVKMKGPCHYFFPPDFSAKNITIDYPASWFDYTVSRIHRQLPPMLYTTGPWQKILKANNFNRAKLTYWCTFLALEHGIWDKRITSVGKVFPDLSIAFIVFDTKHLTKMVSRLMDLIEIPLESLNESEIINSSDYANLYPIQVGSSNRLYFYTPTLAPLKLQKYSWSIKIGTITARLVEVSDSESFYRINCILKPEEGGTRYLTSYPAHRIKEISTLLISLNEEWQKGKFLGPWAKYYYLRTKKISSFPLHIPKKFQLP